MMKIKKILTSIKHLWDKFLDKPVWVVLYKSRQSILFNWNSAKEYAAKVEGKIIHTDELKPIT